MFKYNLTDAFRRSATISLTVSSPHDRGSVVYAGDAALVRRLQETLSLSYGAFGHLIGDRTTAIDLDAAMRSDVFKEYKPELIEGAELVESYDPGIPEGAQT